ncbi:MAG: TRAP transporter small permease [Chloroflexi bacterium]|nr:MAG: TRAP transporter small permease [Chloroflexota bacterium]
MAFIQVVLRNFFRTGLPWADLVLRHLVLWLGMLGASLATRQEKHISIDVITRFLSVPARHGLRIVLYAFSALICFFLFYASWDFVAEERAFGSLFFGSLPLWPFQLILPVGFALLAFRFALHAITRLWQGEER